MEAKNIKNIMKAQLYQLVRNRSLRAVLLAMIAVTVFFGASDKIAGGKGTTACSFFVQMLSTTVNLVHFTIAIATAIVCADDFTDKTANNELVSGRLRSEAYLARAAVSVILSVIFSLILVLALLVTTLALYPRGYELTSAAIVQRILLVIPIAVRLSCFYVFVSYIVKKPIAVVGICYALFCFASILGMTGTGAGLGSMLTGFGSMKYICTFDSWHTYGLNTPVYYVYDGFVKGGTAAALTAVSLTAGGVYLLLGYSFFHRDDIQ